MMRKNTRVFFGVIAAAILSLSAGAAVWSVSELSNQDQITEVRAGEGTYWSGLVTNGSQYGNTYRKAIQDIIKAKNPKTIGYSSNNAVLKLSDENPKHKGYITPFYHGPDQYINSGWNKEHVWPNSRGAGETGPGADPQMLRPTISSENSNRGNAMYAESGAYDPASLGYADARGQAARIIFYTATRYYQTHGTGGSSKGSGGLELTNNVGDAASNNTMGKLSDLLKWNSQYPVSDYEIYRNDYLTGQGFARNPFIDHPDWANYIWDSNGIRSSAYTPNTSSYSGSSTSSQTTSTSQEVKEIFDLVKNAADVAFTKASTISILGKATDGSYQALKPAIVNSYYVDRVQVSVSADSMSYADGVGIFEVEPSAKASGLYTLKDVGTTAMGYLSGSTKNTNGTTHYNLGFEATETENSQWDIAISGDGKMTLKSASGVYAKYDSTYSDFTGSSTSADLFAFKKKDAAVAVTSISLNLETLSLKIDETSTLVATINPENAANKIVAWSSSDEAVASVDQSGIVSARKAGEATITVTSADGGFTDSCLVHVDEKNPDNPGGGSFPTWAIVAIATGGSLVGIGLAVLAAFLVVRFRKKKTNV